jgi:hypothetical protein
MICRTGVQDRLKIRLDALVELPFKNSGLLLRLGAFPTNDCCTLADEPQSMILARAANVPDKHDLITNYAAEYPWPNLLDHLAMPGWSKIKGRWDRCGVYLSTQSTGANHTARTPAATVTSPASA